MALPSNGPIDFSDINIELNFIATAQRSLGETTTRTLFGVSSGAIRLGGDGYGKSSGFAATISSDQSDLNLRTWALANGWDGSSTAVITVAPNIYVYSTSTSNAGITVDGSWPGGLTLINNGFIMGMGGRGGSGNPYAAGLSGGPAMSLGVSCSITNNSYIGGGGGGGGINLGAGGGGAGGGAGGQGAQAFQAGWGGLGGAGGAIGATGSTGSDFGDGGAGGGGGGRIFPGTGGAGGLTSGGNIALGGAGGGAGGGGGGFTFAYYGLAQNGFAGGDAGNSGGIASPDTYAGGGGGGWGAAGGTGWIAGGGYAGGTGGKCVELNGHTITWNAIGTRYGAIS